jgi:hypothetical protein
MEKRSKNEWFSEPERVNVEPPVIEEISTVRIILLRQLIVNYTGKVTGKLYKFPGAGSIVEVDKRDVDQMLQYGANRHSCCSGSEISPYFRILEA